MASCEIADTSRLRRETDNISSGTSKTVCFWIYPGAFGANVRVCFLNSVFVLSKYSASSARCIDNGATTFGTMTRSSGSYATGVPVFWAFTISSANGARLYWNATLADSDATVTSGTGDTGFHIGETSNAFAGEFGDVRIYDRELTAAEIETVYACRGMDSIINDLGLRWIFTEKAPGTTYADNDVVEHADAVSYTRLSQGTVAPSAGDGNLAIGYRRRMA